MDDDAPVLVWFRDDLRLADNPALAAAAATGRPVLALHCLDERIGGASRWWLHHSLQALDGALRQAGTRLVLRRGDPPEAVAAVAAESGADSVHWNRRYDPGSIAIDSAAKAALRARGLRVESFPGGLLHEPWTVRSGGGLPYRVFGPFWRAIRARDPGMPVPAPAALRTPGRLPASERLEDWRLLPRAPDWAGGLRETWRPGEAAAQRRLEEFLGESLALYTEQRDRPDLEATSRLSPHLRWGEISPRRVWQAAQAAAARPGGAAGAEKFLAELGWREFSHHLLFHFPDLPTRPLRPAFDAFPWAADEGLLRAWCAGRTGYPIVDAGMRQLWRTGWMHNRVRMIAASFLTKHLLQPWQAGAAWFLDTLVDADIASNSANWQWVAGCGTDAAPYFRIFNPVLQGRKFDPDGAYVRRFLPEIAHIGTGRIHEVCGSVPPVVDLDRGRRRALDAYGSLRKKPDGHVP